MMRIALVGAGGQLGTALRPLLGNEVVPLGRDELDVTDAVRVQAVLEAAAPQGVVNVAAWNLVDRAEDEPQPAWEVNALGPRNLARYCGERDLPLLHVSTDYVFGLDADRTVPYREEDLPGPLGVYAVSKLAGEQFVRSHCRRHFVVRTCGLYGHQATRGKGNFVETMLRLGATRDELRVVDDQRCTPTAVADLAPALAALVQTDAYGVYHATNAGSMTWCEFAREILRQTGCGARVVPISTAEFGAKAPRPRYSVLDNSRLARTLGWGLRPWQEALAEYLKEREPSGERVGSPPS